ncbi:ABC transporter permease subunit [Aerococcaceae bacterium NML210727]|nr:ABC transporter permease subunit [Aerococcaceae bacterium NML210727]MCW6654737.1 ABC transporter permease subunit [Aerococcaceae bacterium NML201296]MCW6660746.1 ABC transporter permease subunit [Aerococcaceae bacterium NML201209]MCW6664765.1 ABC transporter permease subunit [Aerococcaceae bacterium NML191219]MCW6667402.1 ABC transporter permease subunit [Aerococcaceae bacterium NML190938]MCW6675122.1 ABC transporter permease subunit [Aerococcaceae bacterium NML171108]MCW6676472.1 ABC tran
MENSQGYRQDEKKAMLLSLIPGLGQFYNRQAIKGAIFFGIAVLFVIEMIAFGFGALQGFVTLGSTPMEDHSLFMMIRGTLQIIITAIFAIFYYFNIRDARNVARLWNKGEKPSQTVKELLDSVYNNGFPYLLIIPAYLFMAFAIIFPVLVTIFTAFMNYDFKHIPPAFLLDWVGFQNFLNIFTLSTFRDAFMSVFTWTIIWTICATTLQIVLGVFTAIVAHQPFIKGKRIFGVIFLLPWAVPAFITIMTFSNMFNDSIGAINTQVIPFLNHLIPFVDIPALSWKTDPTWTKVAVILIQGWLGFPYIYVMTTSILQSISEDLYEAAKIDGANAVKRFTSITLPVILSVAAPIFMTQYTGNFNNFSMIYLFNNGGPGSVGGGAGATDILISWIFKLTTGTSPQFSVAAALTLIISLIVITVSLIVFKKTNAFNMEEA